MAPNARHLAVLARLPALPVVVARVYKSLEFFRGVQIDTLTRASMGYLAFLRFSIFLVFLVNAGSWPFVWHVRVFWPIIVARLRFLLLRASLLFKSPSERKRIVAERVEALCPVGANPFELVTVYRRWASIDDVDMFGMHLSNSSYAKGHVESVPSLEHGFISDTDKLEKTLTEALAATNRRSRTPIVEADGSVLHCIAVSQLCFKQGRISVPPALVLACEGFCNPPPRPVDSSAEPGSLPTKYSASNPPPHWAKVRAMRVPPTGSMKQFKEFLAGGWKTGAEKTGDKWWEQALSGPIEEKRKKNLEVLHALRTGMESVTEAWFCRVHTGCQRVAVTMAKRQVPCDERRNWIEGDGICGGHTAWLWGREKGI
ncbi:hypothetical protein PISMIDRAFT_22890 [Pisolithus microcarpus 441]|uniref:Unplaced genomic scaffold scaffold_26, whole genome shotgun sequence n=1 Tax=Pisolithus microcarpus 441 TaxID=765257 RepID=A0A0C9ZZE6_9AGAM|nr:hypothetical protein PISMIDRAFT_22890 [Pisolithus microcarpus 441]